jgi:hypothetical protein
MLCGGGDGKDLFFDIGIAGFEEFVREPLTGGRFEFDSFEEVLPLRSLKHREVSCGSIDCKGK